MILALALYLSHSETEPYTTLAMNNSFFDYEKATQALLYIITEIKNAGQHQSYKTLYRAEQEYMREYGETILGDTFTKMVDGPVPSHVRNLIQMAAGSYKGRWLGTKGIEYMQTQLCVVDGKYLHPLVSPDLDYLAETEKAVLDKAIAYCRDKSFAQLRDESHDKAWHAAVLGQPMDTLEIAQAGGASEEALEYLQESLLNSDYHSL